MHNAEHPVTCYDYLGKPKNHSLEQRYVSPTTGVCRKLVVQAVNPSRPSKVKEVAISNHANHASKRAAWLLSHCPIRRRNFFKWIRQSVWFAWSLLWPIIWFLAQPFFQSDDDPENDTEWYITGCYKPYRRAFRGQLWAARSLREYSSSRVNEQDASEENIRTRTLYPRLLMIHNPNRNEWIPCTNRDIIICTKFIAISYRAIDAYEARSSSEKEQKAQFIDEVRAAVLGQKFDAYWLDLECLGKTPSEKNLDVYCMADVYRRAEETLIMLGKVATSGENECWRDWGKRVWTFPEALLSSRLCYKFRDREEVKPLSLFELANLAYEHSDDEQAIINSYGGKDPLEMLERLTLLKQAIWQRTTTRLTALASGPLPPPEPDEEYPAVRVYALMGFFEHRILPNPIENDLRALARLSMANDNDRIVERMVAMLPRIITEEACWYADRDIYDANLWDVIPELQVAGVTENRALVLDGCRAASIRWKDFPEVAFATTHSLRRKIIGFIPYLSWPIFITGIGIAVTINKTGGIILIIIGIVLVFLSPRLFLFSQSGRIITAQPWLIGVKGVIKKEDVESQLYGGTIRNHFPRMNFTPSGSWFSTPEQSKVRQGSDMQYQNAKEAESGQDAGYMYTLIDTHSSTMYYFRAERAPTVCIFAGREGGLGRFVLCSENCQKDELHKESVLRMPTEISQKMELCGWVALG
ncbi:hypothetical protein EDB19DRAFT_1641432 [Suillus lakei]|nr:hypothetical protein EDB19DRAFT_1641432 [Suillus lakei]